MNKTNKEDQNQIIINILKFVYQEKEAFILINSHFDFEEFQTSMFEGCLSWGISAVSRFLNLIAEEKGIKLTTDLKALSSLIKYGVPSKLACWLVKQKIRREDSVILAESCIDKMSSEEMPFDMPISEYAQMALRLLTEDELINLNEASIERIHKIRIADAISLKTSATTRRSGFRI